MVTTLSAVDRIFDLIAGGTPTAAAMEAKWAIEDAATDGTPDSDALALRTMAESLAAWSKWTEDGAERQLSDMPEDYLEELTFQASARGVEAWRELAIRSRIERDPVTRKALAQADAAIAMIDRALGDGAVALTPATEEVG